MAIQDSELDAMSADETIDLMRRAFKSASHKVAEAAGQTFDSSSVILTLIEEVLADQALPLHPVAFALHIASTRASLIAAQRLAENEETEGE